MKIFLSLLLAVFAMQLSIAQSVDSTVSTTEETEQTNQHTNKPQTNWHESQDLHYEQQQPIWKTSLISNIAPFIFVAIIILIMQISKFLKRKQMNELALRYIELGKEIPEDLFKEEKDIKSPLKIGIILSSIGVGMFIMFAVFLDLKMSSIAAVPFFMGLGFILIDKLERKSNAKQIDNE